MAGARLDEILEAALLAAGEPLSLDRLEGLFDAHECPPRRDLRDALGVLETRLESSALELIESASGYQMRIRQRLSPWVSRLWDERPQRYSRALLETLALIAYRQPVTRGDIEEVRGVSVSGSIMRTLGERGWIRVVGHRDVPGRPAVYATTRQFLDDFGLKTLDALPPMHELQGFAFAEETAAESPDTEVPASPGGDGDVPETAGSDYAGDEGGEAESVDDGETPETASDAAGTMHDPTAGMADETTHAGTASARPGLSFADLEARLADRARRRDGSAHEGDADDGDSAEHSSNETSSDS
ncbi:MULTISPECIES: SMC-Scp complex subunit ScpB [unclassified Modicisalibacter]|uniref:SMC-Scp complex subunit ScpB n=1 Tax=unclassified Modicisalibacter TaxID=2679913 RepID=UPI001CCA21C6|nr:MULTISPECIES: SMC-Scp complex subunit ScpB [unclassified Modicisalibacter]MBZ9557829.1 SMC-Scp complex subunit ScpB [Modicisalibacter sp. R2A 31.J]MBZ9573505.1 SMC-Scp complex subunit ScpB [Modicisalibacter sp. MOD 31.J]